MSTTPAHDATHAQDAAHDAAHGLRTITSPTQQQQHHYHHNQLWYQPWRQMTHQLSFYKSSYHTTTRCSQMLMMWCPLLLCMMGEAPSAILVLVSFVPLLKLIYYKYSVASLLSFPFVKYIPSSLPIIHHHLLPIKSCYYAFHSPHYQLLLSLHYIDLTTQVMEGLESSRHWNFKHVQNPDGSISFLRDENVVNNVETILRQPSTSIHSFLIFSFVVFFFSFFLFSSFFFFFFFLFGL